MQGKRTAHTIRCKRFFFHSDRNRKGGLNINGHKYNSYPVLFQIPPQEEACRNRSPVRDYNCSLREAEPVLLFQLPRKYIQVPSLEPWQRYD